MKFLLFSDLHYWPGVFLEDRTYLHRLQKRAEETGCEMMIHTGDFCHGGDGVLECIEEYNNFHIPSYHCLGNHDTERTPFEETLKRYRMPNNYYCFDRGGYRFIITDPNYYKDRGDYIAYTMGNFYDHPDTIDYMPPEQLVWMENTIAESELPCLIFSHESFERCDGVRNQEEVRGIIDAANRRKKNSVIMCVNGHNHSDFVRIWNDVVYFDVNSVSYCALARPHDLYPKEVCKKRAGMPGTVWYNEPLSAVVTLTGNTIKVEGSVSSMYLGITRVMTGTDKYDPAGREATPEIQSFEITLS